MSAIGRKSELPAGELELIRRIRSRQGARGGRGALRLGIGDDCALLRVKAGEEIAITTDLSIEGRHFDLHTHPPESIGHRTAARGLSDLAAMGARPVAAFLSLGLPEELTVPRGIRSWMERFYDGFLGLASRHNTPLAGGDLAATRLAMADVVLAGSVPEGRALLRSGARAGDLIYVTGMLGGAAAGLRQLRGLAEKQGAARRQVRIPNRLEPVLRPHLYPEPRVAQGLWLQSRGIATAAIDVSDGLSSDLTHLCEESGLCADVDFAALPVAPGATLEDALHGGEEYELLFTARPAARLPRTIRGVTVTRIGLMVKRRPGAPRMVLRTPGGAQPLARRGWEHFSPQS